MKKYYILPLFLFCFVALFAQDKVSYSKHFVSFRGGYSIPVSSSQVGSPRSEVGKTYLNFETVGGNVVKYSEKNSFGSRGSGLNFSLGYGYMITQNFSFEIDFNYLYTLGFTDASWEEKQDGKTYLATQESSTSMFRATPMFGVYANEDLLIRPYAKFGLIVPFAGGTSVQLNIDDETGRAFEQLMPVIDPITNQQVVDLIEEFAAGGIIIPGIPTSTKIKAVTSGAFSLGFMARLGGEYKFKNVLNGKLKLFAEMEMQMLTVKSNQTKIKEFFSTVSDDATKGIASSNGIKTEFNDSDIPEILSTTNYINEVTESSNSTYDVTNPNYNRDKAFDQLTFRDNYNAFAFMIGLKYNF